MSDEPMTTLEVVAQALLDSDVEQGHANPDSPWGRYEVLARAVLERLGKRGVISGVALKSILEGKL